MNTSATGSRDLAKVLPFLVVAVALTLAALAGQRPSARYLLLGAGVLGLLILVRYPGLGLVVLAGLSFTLPLEFGTGTEVALTPPVFLIPAVGLAWLVDGLRRRSLRLPASRTTLPLLLFLVAGLLALLAGNAYWDPLVPRPGNLLLVQLAQWGLFALSVAVFLFSAELGARGRWLEWATWVALGLASVVILEFYLPPLRRILGWSSATLANRSLFWTWLPALAAGQLLFNRRLRPAVRLWLVLLVAAAAYVVWFRLNDWVSGWAPFTISAVVVVWLWVWRRNRAWALVAGLALVAVAVVLFPAIFAHAGGQQEVDLSWHGRQLLYRRVLELVKDHPILGLGPASYRHYAFGRWLSLGAGRALYLRPVVSSHNNYIDIYAQMGLVGLGLFLWFLVELGLVCWRLMSRPRPGAAAAGGFGEGYVAGAAAGLAGTLVAMMLADWFLPFVYNIGFPGFRTSALAWMFLGGLVALEQSVRAEVGGGDDEDTGRGGDKERGGEGERGRE